MRSKSSENSPNVRNLLSKANFLYSRAVMWPTLLGVNYQCYHSVEDVRLEQPNQRVIKFDVLRTRGFFFDSNLKRLLESLLTYYVVQDQISYKQGLHEIAALFIIFIQAGQPISVIYQMFHEFIKRFMTNFFDDDFQGIQCVLQAYDILLKYHDMELYNQFVRTEFPPQLFAIPWFITLFINKSNFEIAQMIVENTILMNDKYFIFSFNIAVLIKNKQNIITKGKDLLPQFMSAIYLDNEQDYFDIIKIALKVHTHTPRSFWISLDQLNLFNHHAKPVFFTGVEKSTLYLIEISPQEVTEMLNQHIFITQKWNIKQYNHPQVEKLISIFVQQTYHPQQPILICYNINESVKESLTKNALVHIADLHKQHPDKILQQLENFQITNKLWICFLVNKEKEQFCIIFSQIYLVTQFFHAICERDTKYICKCDEEEFLEYYCNQN